jgi:hypothetical protein
MLTELADGLGLRDALQNKLLVRPQKLVPPFSALPYKKAEIKLTRIKWAKRLRWSSRKI